MAISSTFDRPTATRDFTTTLGFAGILGSPMLAFGKMAADAGQIQLSDMLLVLFLLGWTGSVHAMRRTRAFGSDPVWIGWSNIQLGLLVAALLWQISQALQIGNTATLPSFRPGDALWPICLGGMTFVGLGALAGSWQGWRRYAPLACGMSFPLTLGLPDLLGPSWSIAFGVLAAYAWSGLGLAVVLEARRLSKEPNAG